MPRHYEGISRKALKKTAEDMCLAARTSPKTRGIDNLVIIIPTPEENKKIITMMRKIAKRDSRPSCERDAGNFKPSAQVVIIGTKTAPLGLNCGFCGFGDCSTLSKKGAVCAYNSMDLGIALGSAAALAGRMHVDNRLMFSIGKAAMECGVLKKDVKLAIGIPLSATGKNPFFDRT